MFKKLKRLYEDNSVSELLSGNMVVADEVVNEFVNRVGIKPPLTRVSVLFREDVIEVEGSGEVEGVVFSFQGALGLLGVRITGQEQVVKLMPRGPLRFTTPHINASVNLKECPGLLAEIKAFVSQVPEEQTQGVVIEDTAIILYLHENPIWSEQFQKALAESPLAKRLGINPLDYVVINDVRIEKGAIRLIAKRA